MNTNELRYAIESSFCKCAQIGCEEVIDGWPDADASEPGRKVVYVPQVKLFVGICPNGHYNEFPVKRVKAGQVDPLDVTVRTMGRYVSQNDCTHGKRGESEIPAGQQVVTAKGPVDGPAKIWMCGWCGYRERLTSKNEQSKIILP